MDLQKQFKNLDLDKDLDKDVQEIEENLPPDLPEKVKDFVAPEVVFDFIIELVTKAKENGEEIEIQQWKGLPKNGNGMESNGVGGGGTIRLCKFYIKHTDVKGVARMREVQIFLPKEESGIWVSGKVDYDNKKTDDERYSISRLFTHGNVYSLIELLFPYDIYGEGMKAFFKVNH